MSNMQDGIYINFRFDMILILLLITMFLIILVEFMTVWIPRLFRLFSMMCEVELLSNIIYQ